MNEFFIKWVLELASQEFNGDLTLCRAEIKEVKK